jgi:hypothetical protein
MEAATTPTNFPLTGARTRLKNYEVLEAWSRNGPGAGRNMSGSYWFNGSCLYSYRTLIARFINNPPDGGLPVCLISDAHRSKTTREHTPRPHEIEGARTFVVFDVGADQPHRHRVNAAEMGDRTTAAEYAAAFKL